LGDLNALQRTTLTGDLNAGRRTTLPGDLNARRTTSPTARKHPPTTLYIEEEPEKRLETFTRWKQQQKQRHQHPEAASTPVGEDSQQDLSHLVEIQEQIERFQSQYAEERAAGRANLSFSSTEERAAGRANLSLSSAEERAAGRANLSFSSSEERAAGRANLSFSSTEERAGRANLSFSSTEERAGRANQSFSSSEEGCASGRISGSKQSETPPTVINVKPPKAAKVKDKKSSLSSIFGIFSRKKVSKEERKKSSIVTVLESTSGSVLSPDVQKQIIVQQPEQQHHMEEEDGGETLVRHLDSSPAVRRPERTASFEAEPPPRPYSAASAGRHSQYYPVVPPLILKSSRGPTPDPDYDNFSLNSSPRAPRLRSHRGGFDENSSDTSCDEYGRGGGGSYTPRSAVSEFRIPRYKQGSAFAGFGRGISPSLSEPVAVAASRRAPSTDSFFGKHGATVSGEVGGGSNSQLWYQQYKHSSFSQSSGQNTFGEPVFGAFDGRITNMRGNNV